MVDNNGTLWLKENHIEKRVKYGNLSATTRKYHSDFRKQRCKILNKPKKHSNEIFFHEKMCINGNKRL